MAEKKTTAKSTKTAKKAVEVKSREDLQKELTAKQTEMLETRRSHRAGELVNPRAITQGRKEIARLKTAIRADELKGDK
jgi:large subunit ribosomal protein L29|tara:strand:- start:2391 stop:2627 length:237 start_codon:yes stop_codon:yes gene_type:complete